LHITASSPNALGIPSSKLNKSPSDKRNDHGDLFRKLASFPSSDIDASSITHGVLPRPSQFPAVRPSPSQGQAPVSLASFIGGRATGPRLNRHAPQQDAHDPTQFERRTINAPHPIFGKGGVAMPGMVTKPGTSVRKAVQASEAVERYQPRLVKRPSTPSIVNQAGETPASRPISPQISGKRDRTISNPPDAAPRYLEQAQLRPVSPQKSGNRERTLSTPGPSLSTPRSNDNFSSRPIFSHTNIETRPSHVENRPKSPGKDRLSTPSLERTPGRPATSRHAPAAVNTPASPNKSSIVTPSLARVIQPESRASPHARIMPTNTVPSPAFQKPPSLKDLTPSISRLQGRGFVQNMVKASTELESSAKSSPSSPASKPSSGRKSSVLDRWQANVTSSPTPAPILRQTSPVRRTHSELPTRSDPPLKPSPRPRSTTPSPSPAKALKTKTSHPHLHPDPLSPPEPLSPRYAKLAETMPPPEGAAGFGSATTMVVYKPAAAEKTIPPESNLPSAVDELGVRRDPSPGGKGSPRFSATADIPSPAGKPLNHVRSFW
jgi:hypothetical protein